VEASIRHATRDDAEALADLIRRSFRDVAERFGLNRDNAPTHASNCEPRWLRSDFERGVGSFVASRVKAPAGGGVTLSGRGALPRKRASRSSKMRHSLLLIVGFTLAAGAVPAQPPEAVRGAELLTPFKRDLQQALRDGLADDPVEAISACRIQAPEIAASLAQGGVRVGRASHRLRNPANTPPAWVELILAGYAVDPADRTPQTVRLADDRVGYVEPILVQPLCLTCHGEALAPEIAARIELLYPEDRAVGYGVDELRGVFWVEFPSAE
jgi:hypothetical protein